MFPISEFQNQMMLFLIIFGTSQKLMSLVWAEIELHIHFNIRHKAHAYVCLRYLIC